MLIVRVRSSGLISVFLTHTQWQAGQSRDNPNTDPMSLSQLSMCCGVKGSRWEAGKAWRWMRFSTHSDTHTLLTHLPPLCWWPWNAAGDMTWHKQTWLAVKCQRKSVQVGRMWVKLASRSVPPPKTFNSSLRTLPSSYLLWETQHGSEGKCNQGGQVTSCFGQSLDAWSRWVFIFLSLWGRHIFQKPKLPL